ncbi:glutathione S-transferase family protein [Minwuia thermotolerans]|uniref:Glutathione S-transferase n=1 Tax=Minwuia thermotolerans TaxID=2056226 RepID=A0A2M9FYB9_9PROT|nr:glutathione S-transferase family protein [Minwuia thermotolerans]PJK28455.1 glutathione S-transferase [Minwuia thermotolerans]
MLRLYDNLDSGNGYKVRLLLSWLEIPFERVEVDTYAGESRRPEFLARSPNGKVPVLDLGDGDCLWESGAILFYLADGTAFLPDDRRVRAEVLKWMFFEQYSHEPYIAVLRSWSRHGALTEERKQQWAARESEGYRALDIMEGQLERRDWFVGEKPTIADIALFAYTHVADQGGFDLGRHPAIRRWIERVRSLPRFRPLDQP